MYDLLSYGRMVSDTVRANAYAEALRRVITRESIVLDIGTGPGFFALLACQLGARRVIAVEPDDVIEIARKTVAANHCADKIEFIRDFSFRISLDERVDVIISDLRGVLPWFQSHLLSIIDARKRLLAPTGKLIPSRDVVWGVPVQSEELYLEYKEPWCSRPQGVDLSTARRFAVNLWRKGKRILPSQLLGQPQKLATLDYLSIEDVNVSSTASWNTTTPGTAHGFLVWFDADLVDGIGFSNNPLDPQLIYGNAFFPLSEPVELRPGETLALNLRANFVGEDYIWGWNTTVSTGDSPGPRVELKQSTFFGAALSHALVAKRAETFTPNLGDDGLIDKTILQWMDGKLTLSEISQKLREEFPSRFHTPNDALAKVGELSLRYSKPTNASP